VVGAIARHGGAIILGRGAHLILRPGEGLRVLVVAPLEARIATMAAANGISEREAKQRIAAEEAARRAFLMKHFHADFGDPVSFDVVVNTQVLGVEGAVEVVAASLARLPVPVAA
jgi:cytidylate kinase